MYILPGHTCIGAVRQRYMADVGVDGSFVDEAGSSLADDRALAELAGDGPGRQVIALTFEQTARLRLEVEEAWTKLSVTLDVLGTEQWPELLVKMVAAIEEATEARLQAMESDDSEAEASQSDGDEASQSDGDEAGLPSHSTVGEVRLFHGEHRLVLRGTLMEALMRYGAPGQRCFHLRLERQRTVAVMKGSKPALRQVWPADEVGDLAEGRAAWSDGRIVQAHDTAWDIDLVEEGIVVLDPLILTLRLSDAHTVTVRAPKWATVGDVRRLARSLTHRRQLHLRRGNALLDDDYLSLQQAGLVQDPLLIVDAEMVTLSVDIHSLSLHPLTWRPTKRSLTVSDLINDIMQLTGASERSLERTVFACVGCGRRLWKDEASTQTLPVPCCAVESRRLSEWSPPKTGDC